MAEEKKPAAKKPAEKKAPVERTFVKVGEAEAAAKAPAAKKEAPAKTEAPKPEAAQQPAEAKTATATQQPADTGKNPLPFRIFAFICWAVALAGMVFACMMIVNGDLTLLLVGLGVAAVFCFVGAQLWKKANKLRPCKSENKIVRFLYYQMGSIATFVIFLPIGLFLLLKSDKLGKKGKTVATVAAVALVAIVGLVAAEWNPPPVEEITPEQLEQKAAAGEVEIPEDLAAPLTAAAYWTQYGKVYHLDPDCYHITRSLVVYEGSLADAINAGRDRGCSNCASGTTVIPDTTDEPADDIDTDDSFDDSQLDDADAA